MFRFIARREVEADVSASGDMLKQLAELSQALQLLRRQTHLIGLCLVGLGELDDALGLRKRQRTEQHPVHDCEYCSVRADAERQRQDGDYSKAKTLRQHPRGESRVLPERFHRAAPATSSVRSDARFLRFLDDAAVKQVNRASERTEEVAGAAR